AVTLKSTTCATTGLVAPQVDAAQCTPDDAGPPIWDEVKAPADTDEIGYTVAGPDGDHKVTVTATALGDVFLTQSGGEWTIDADKKAATIEIQLTSKDCATTELVAPQVDAAQCTPGTAGQTVWSTVTAPV